MIQWIDDVNILVQFFRIFEKKIRLVIYNSERFANN